MDKGYDQAPWNIQNFNDGWMRTFTKIPEFDKKEIKMMRDWLKEGLITHLLLYLTEKKYGYNMGEDTAIFIAREIQRGFI